MKKSMLAAVVMMMSGMAFAAESAKETVVQSVFKDTGVSVKAGLNGAGIDLTKSFNDYVKVRAGYSQVSVSKDYTQDEITYDGKLKLGGWNLLADYHPFAGSFRVTGGVYGPSTKFNANAKYTGAGTVEINGNTYTSAQVPTFNTEVKWNGTKPYLGIGWDGFNAKKASGIYFTSDVGVIFSGSPKVSLNANCADPTVCSRLANDVAAEKASIVDDLHNAKWLPVIQVGVGYRF